MGCRCMYTLDVFNENEFGTYEIDMSSTNDHDATQMNSHSVDVSGADFS